jgi:hypothetical protein
MPPKAPLGEMRKPIQLEGKAWLSILQEPDSIFKAGIIFIHMFVGNRLKELINQNPLAE